jgi:hypothetical protein
MKKSRLMGLLIILTLTLLATWYASGLDAEPEQDLVAAVEDRPRRPAPPPPPLPEQKNALLKTPSLGAGAAASKGLAREPLPQRVAGNLFAARSWQPPPPPAPAAAPAPPPRAPELPYRYLGRLEDGDQVVVFLLQGNRELVVRQGDQLPNYRVDEITRRGMSMTYLPLNATQRMLFGSDD